jgi:RHS repeat-associated protein
MSGPGEFFDQLGDTAEKAVDAGAELMGEGVEFAGNKAAGVLDSAGLESGADAVRDGTEALANQLGVQVDERKLGQTDDPKELVHGSPDKLEERSRNLKRFAAAFEKVGQGMRGLDAGSWRGKAADSFRENFDVQPKQWLKAADANEDASKALHTFAQTLRWAQGEAREAIHKWNAAERASQRGLAEHNAQVKAYNAEADTYNAAAREGGDPGPKPAKPGEFTDPGKEGREAAEHQLAEARKQRNSAADDAAAKVSQALQSAPAKPSFTDRMQVLGTDYVVGSGLNTAHALGGALKELSSTVKLVRTVNPLDSYNLTHPGQYLANSNMVLSGLVSTAAHPERLPKAIIGSGWGSDPGDASGGVIAGLVGGKGLGGVGRGAARGALKSGGKGAARESLDGAGNTLDKVRRELDRIECGDPVDVATGRMFLPQTDIELPALMPLAFSRMHESSYRAGRWFGQSWASTVDQRLEVDAEGVVFVCADGSLLPYPHPAVGVATQPIEGRRRWPLTVDRHGDYTITDPETGRTWHFDAPSDTDGSGDGVALLSQITDRSTQWLNFAYGADGAPAAVEHSGGYRLEFTTEDGRITALRLAGVDEPLVRYGYDDHGHLATVTNSSGRPTQFTNDADGRMLAWRDTNGSSYSYVYDEQHRCTYQSGTEGHLRSTYRYETLEHGEHATCRTDSLGHTTRYVIDRRCRLIAETDPTGATTRTTYDERDRPLTVEDPLGRVTSYAYDAAGRVVLVVRPDGHYTSVGRDDAGNPVVVAGPEGLRARQQWDEHGNRTAVTDATGATTRFTYTGGGHLTAVTGALGNTTHVATDRAGLPLTVTDPLGATTKYERDAFGRPVRLTDPLGNATTLTWTAEGRLATRTGPDGAMESWTYDGEGNCTRHADAVGGETTYEYTHFDLLTAQTGPDGVRHEFAHDTELRLRQVTNPQGLTWDYTYDPAGRLISETDFDGRMVTYEVDAAGQLATRISPLGQRVSFSRDELGRISSKDADGALTSYAYDEAGRLTRAAGPYSEILLARDAVGRIVSERAGDGRELRREYDALGRCTRRTTPAGTVSEYAYDAAGNCTAVTTGGRTLEFTHDASGRETFRRLGESVSLSQLWEPSGRLSQQTLQGPGGPLQTRSYSYRSDGYLTVISDQLNGDSSFDVDAAGRVTTVRARGWTESYAYDEAGNQTRADWPAEHANPEARGERTYAGTRLGTAGRIRYEHDSAGRMVLRQKHRLSRKPDTWRYAWDAEDRLTSVVTPDGTRWRYLYDPMGRRTAKLRLGADGESVAERTDFTWDGPTLIEQTTVSSMLADAVTLTWDHDGHTPLSQTERITDGTTQSEIDSRFFAIVTDLVGTPSELVDEHGDIAWRTRTTLWGTTTWTADATAYTPLRFPGQYYDPETGLHYNVHRYYDPTTARFTSPDPLGLEPAPNPVTYVHNPHLWIDPLGLGACPPDVALGIREDGLREFADSRGFTHYLDSDTWEAEVRAAAHSPNTRLHVSLDGFNGSTPADMFMQAYNRGMGDRWFATEREMYHVGKAVRLGDREWESINFYENGRLVKVPEPESWPTPKR